MFTSDNQQTALDALSAQWKECKREEKEANVKRLAVEKEFAEILDIPEDGILKVAGMKIHTGYTRKWDQEKLLKLQAEIRAEFFPFESTLKENRAVAKHVEKEFPDLWALIADALTLTPSKASFSILPPPKD
tara:strand:+ start:6009 stop:6404 length:396 start_codon:yes stop_codon:yes gene_type:complete